MLGGLRSIPFFFVFFNWATFYYYYYFFLFGLPKVLIICFDGFLANPGIQRISFGPCFGKSYGHPEKCNLWLQHFFAL